MNQFSLKRRINFLFVSFCLLANASFSQSLLSSPENIIRPIGPNSVTVNLQRSEVGWGNTGTYVWTVSPAIGVTLSTYSQADANVMATFTAAATGAYTFRLTRGAITSTIVVNVGNLAASAITNNSPDVFAFSVQNGNYGGGPGFIFSPLVETAALGLSQNGYFYYLSAPVGGNGGSVTVYAVSPDGNVDLAVGQVDINGASANDLGFVRLAVDAQGVGWILAGDNTQLYLARFTTNNTSPVIVANVDPSVTLVNGSPGTFFNGDICFSGGGTMFAIASNGSVTQLFTGNPNGANTTLTKKWDLVDENGAPFATPVTGIAFDLFGSLYISTATEIYYIGQNTVNNATGTVTCELVANVTGLTDLASNFYPQQSALPVTLLSFAGAYNSPITKLSWSTAAEVNFDRFEIERSSDGINFISVGSKPATGAPTITQEYLFDDDLSLVNGLSFAYRLKMLDKDGSYKYSKTITVRKDTEKISGLRLNPIPVSGNAATLRFSSIGAGKADIRVIDLTGKVQLRQSIKVYKGNNSISINNIERLRPGTYVIQLLNDDNLPSLKFNVVR